MDLWEGGVSHELEFWEHWLRTGGDRWPNEFQQRTTATSPLQGNITEFLDANAAEVSLLDVGAGPLTIMGKVWPGHKVNITAVDALAKEYDVLLERCDVNPIVRTQACHTEQLLQKFAPNQFDLVHVRNALDHGHDPLLAIRQMLAVVKLNHHVLMDHAVNEAEKAKYEGFHQWNLQVKGDDLHIWNKEHRYSLRKEIKGVAEIVKVNPEAEDWCAVVLQKTAETQL